MNFRTISKRILLSVALVTAFHVAQSKPLLSSSADDLQWLAPYNVVWTNQSLNASESMPCGGGDLGLNVWVENGELLCYLQRSGSFDENNEYLKLGRLRVRLEPNPFVAGGAFRQELKLREGHVEITGQAAALRAKVKVWVEVHRSVIHVEVEASQPVAVNAAYENWRLEDNLLPGKPGKGERFGCFSWEGYPGEIFRYRDEVRQDDAGVWFNHRNRDDKLLFDYMVRQQGLEKAREQLVDTQKGRTFGGVMCGDGFVGDGTGEGVYQNTPFKAWRLKSARSAREQHLQLVTHVAQSDTLKQWQDALGAEKAARKPSLKDARQATVQWWAEFWRRSHIVIAPDKPDENDKRWQIARNYQLFRYQLGCNVRGEYPTKFNGGNFTFDSSLVGGGRPYGPDWRAWGGGSFTAQNQRLVYWPLLKSGDADLMFPQFEFYRRALPNAMARVRSYWGHAGCLFTEQMENFGLPLASAWGWSEPNATDRKRGEEIPFGDTRADGARAYNDLVEHGVQANGAVSYHWESQLEFAYMMLEHQRFFGGDLRPDLPFIQASVRFFDEHYQACWRLRPGQPLDDKGRLVIFPSTSCESYRGARNPADVIAGLSACLESLLALDDCLVTPTDKRYYQDYLKRLPVFTYAEEKGDRILQPAESWKRYSNCECPQFYPLFPFDRFALGRDDMEVFRNTWKHGAFPKNMVQSWHQDGIFFARMGMTAEAADYNVRKLENSKRRFPTFWGPGHDWVPDHNWGAAE